MGKIINGKKMADDIIVRLKPLCDDMNEQYNEDPDNWCKLRLMIVTSGDDDASKVYVRSKERRCEELGIECIRLHYNEINVNACHDIANNLIKYHPCPFIIQLPMMSDLKKQRVMNIIKMNFERKHPSAKFTECLDVDGFMHPNSIAFTYSPKYYMNTNSDLWDDTTPDDFNLPCTPMGIMYMLDHYLNGDNEVIENKLSGKRVVILGRSDLVGKPLQALLLDRDCMVTILHSKSTLDDYKYYIKGADIIVSAMGNTNVLTKEFFSDITLGDKILIDVGMNRDKNGKLRGDCDPEVLDRFDAYTPVPGGVGPMTVACLMANVVKQYCTHESFNTPTRILPKYPFK